MKAHYGYDRLVNDDTLFVEFPFLFIVSKSFTNIQRDEKIAPKNLGKLIALQASN